MMNKFSLTWNLHKIHIRLFSFPERNWGALPWAARLTELFTVMYDVIPKDSIWMRLNTIHANTVPNVHEAQGKLGIRLTSHKRKTRPWLWHSKCFLFIFSFSFRIFFIKRKPIINSFNTNGFPTILRITVGLLQFLFIVSSSF